MMRIALYYNLTFYTSFVKYSPTAISLFSVGASDLLSNLKEGLV